MHWTGGLPVCGHNLNSHRSLITLSPHTQDNDLLLYKYTYMFIIQILKLHSKNTNSKGTNAKLQNASTIKKLKKYTQDNRSLITLSPHTQNNDLQCIYKYTNIRYTHKVATNQELKTNEIFTWPNITN